MRPHIGLDVTPSIRLTRLLGRGGMGSVWAAHHTGLDTAVAVKFLAADLSMSEGALLRFTDEASVAAQIKSPHVVQVYDHGVLDGELPYIVMELLEGQDLGARVSKQGALDLAVTAALVQQLAHVLGKAHQVGVVHRDVKPENVFLLDGCGEVFLKLIDFGIAKWTTRSRSLTATGTMVGTPDFMCPEQILNAKDVGPPADLWALAGVAYFCLLGRPPFSRETLPATILAIEKGEFALPFERHGIGSPALDAFFIRALCRHQAGRFASLNELVATFCEAAEVPIARTLRLVAADGEANEGSRGSASVNGGLLRGGTRLGPGQPSIEIDIELPTVTLVESLAVQTLESGTVVHEPGEAESLSPELRRRAGRALWRRRAVLCVIGALSLAGGAWITTEHGLATFSSKDLLRLPAAAFSVGKVEPPAVLKPVDERSVESTIALEPIQPQPDMSPPAAPVRVVTASAPPSAALPQRAPTRRTESAPAASPRPAASAPKRPTATAAPSENDAPARNLKDRGF